MKNPFRGLLPFEEEHAALFFGRDEEINDISTRLDQRRLLAVTGVSGCGKSSLVHAGVVPMLKAGLSPGMGTKLRVCTIRPGGGPIAELRTGVSIAVNRQVASETLMATTYGLIDAVGVLADHESFLIVVDQFEEIFQYRSDRLAQDEGREAAWFVALLLRAVQQPQGRIFVVLTMRSDFLGSCALFRGLPEALNNGHYLVPRMTREQLRQAIESPLAVVGWTIQPAVLHHLLNECDDEPDNLPVLQHVLKRLYDQGTTPQGDARGGLGRALAELRATQ